MVARAYDFSRIAAVVGGFPIGEFTTDGISHDYDGDDYSGTQGSHGAVTESRMANNISTLTLTILQGSPSQELLRDIHTAAKAGAGFTNVLVKDASGATFITAAKARIAKIAPITLAEEATGYEWTIKLYNPIVAPGANFSL